MKKSLLSLAVILFSMSAFSQTSLSTIAYTSSDVTFSGNTYSPVNPFTAGQGVGILVANQSYTGTDYWDLNSYTGIEMKLTCAADYIGQYMAIRFVMVGTSAAQSIVKTFTFTSTSEVISLDFAADAAETKKLWAIKTPWDGSITGSFSITIDYLNAVNTSTGVKTVIYENPNRLVDVYTITGSLLRKSVKYMDATKGLPKGLYVVDNKKVCVTTE